MYMPIITLFTKAFYQCLHKNLALSCGFKCATGKRTRKKMVRVDILGSFGPTKKEIRSSAVCLRNFVIESAYVQPSTLFESSSVFPVIHSSFLVSAFLVSTQLCNSLILSCFHFI